MKDNVVDEEEKSVVYSIPCKDCSLQYIGQTSHAFLTRKKEHILSMKNLKTEKSALIIELIGISINIIARKSQTAAEVGRSMGDC